MYSCGDNILSYGARMFFTGKEVVMGEYVCTASQLAHYVVDKCTEDREPVSNLQLQKIMYFLQSVYCEATSDLLFADEFEAWPYGPVLSDVYREFSSYGGGLICRNYDDFNSCPFGDRKVFIDEGIKVLRRMSPWDLVKTSHADGSPWSVVWNDGVGYKDTIPNSLIRSSSN